MKCLKCEEYANLVAISTKGYYLFKCTKCNHKFSKKFKDIKNGDL